MPRQKPTSLTDALAHGSPLTKGQLSELLQVSSRQIQRLMQEGLPCFFLGKHSPRFTVAAVEAWLSIKRPSLVTQSSGLHVKEAHPLH